jgi:hypothetical protein
MSQAEVPGKRMAQPADEATEKRWQLIQQNRALSLHYMRRFDLEVKPQPVFTATVRTGRRGADQHDVR